MSQCMFNPVSLNSSSFQSSFRTAFPFLKPFILEVVALIPDKPAWQFPRSTILLDPSMILYVSVEVPWMPALKDFILKISTKWQLFWQVFPSRARFFSYVPHYIMTMPLIMAVLPLRHLIHWAHQRQRLFLTKLYS